MVRIPRIARQSAWKWLGGAVVLLCLAVPFLLRPTLSYYSDGVGLREAVKAAGPSLREVLWQPALSLGAAINRADTDEYEPSVSPDGRYLAFTRGRPGGNADLWISERRGAVWAAPRPIDGVNSSFDDMGAALAVEAPGSSRLVLYFYSDRPGGHGGHDLWLSRGDGEGGFGVPRNLGPQVNGPFDEINPSADSGLLLFASNRRDGAVQGSSSPWSATVRATLVASGFDIFGAPRLAGSEVEYGEALLVEALSLPGSTEGSLGFAPSGDFIYFASDRSGGQGGFDLYRARVTQGVIGAPENLGARVNTSGHEFDPAVGLGGFELYFARKSVGGDSEDILVTTSREVFLTQEKGEPYWQVGSVLRFLHGVLSRTDPFVLAMVSSAILALLFVAIFGRRMTRLALLTRCLVLAFFVHLLLAVWMNSSKVHRALVGTLGEAARWQDLEVMEVMAGSSAEGEVAVAIRFATAETGSDASPHMAAPGLVSPEIFAPRQAAPGLQALNLSPTDVATLAPASARVGAMITPALPLDATPPEPGVSPAIEAHELALTAPAAAAFTEPDFVVTARPQATPEAAPPPLTPAAFASRAQLELPRQEATERIEVSLASELPPVGSEFRDDIRRPEAIAPPSLPARVESVDTLPVALSTPGESAPATPVAQGRALAGAEAPRAVGAPSLAVSAAQSGRAIELVGASALELEAATSLAPGQSAWKAVPTPNAASPSREQAPSPSAEVALSADRDDGRVLVEAPSARELATESPPPSRSNALAVELSSNSLTAVAPRAAAERALELASARAESSSGARLDAPQRLPSRDAGDRPASLSGDLGPTLARDVGAPNPTVRAQVLDASPGLISSLPPRMEQGRRDVDLSSGVARAEELELQGGQARPVSSLAPAALPPRSRDQEARPADVAVPPVELDPEAQPLAFALQARQGRAELVRQVESVSLAVARSSAPAHEGAAASTLNSGLAPVVANPQTGLPPAASVDPPLAPMVRDRAAAGTEPEIVLAPAVVPTSAAPGLVARGTPSAPGAGEEELRTRAPESLPIEAARNASLSSAAPAPGASLALASSSRGAAVILPRPPTTTGLPPPSPAVEVTAILPADVSLPVRESVEPGPQVAARATATGASASSPASAATHLVVPPPALSPLPEAVVQREAGLLLASASARASVASATQPDDVSRPEIPRPQGTFAGVGASQDGGGVLLPPRRDADLPRPLATPAADVRGLATAEPAQATQRSLLPAVSRDRIALLAANETRIESSSLAASMLGPGTSTSPRDLVLSPPRSPPGSSVRAVRTEVESAGTAPLRAPEAPAPQLRSSAAPLTSAGPRGVPTARPTVELEITATVPSVLAARDVPLTVGTSTVPRDPVAMATAAPANLPAPPSPAPSLPQSLRAPGDDTPRVSLPPRDAQLALGKEGTPELRSDEKLRAPGSGEVSTTRSAGSILPPSQRRSAPQGSPPADIAAVAAKATLASPNVAAGGPGLAPLASPTATRTARPGARETLESQLAPALPPRPGDRDGVTVLGAKTPQPVRAQPQLRSPPGESVRLVPVRAQLRAADDVRSILVASVARIDAASLVPSALEPGVATVTAPSVSLALVATAARAATVGAVEPGSLQAVQAQSSFVPKIYQLRASSRRDDAVKLGGGSEETEKAVALGLKWLALHQSPDGRWDLRQYMDHLPQASERDRRHPDWDGSGRNDSRGGTSRAENGDTAATALALLAFLGHGDTQFEVGPYQTNVQRGLQYLLKSQKRDGDLRGGGNLYMHAIASFALCEAYALTRDPALEEPARRAIGYALRTQNPDLGGWRYDPYPQGRDVDTSVFGWMLMAVKSAHVAQIEIEPRALQRMAKYLESARMSKAGGRFAYQPGLPRSSLAMTAQGLFSQQILAELVPPQTEAERQRQRRATNEAVNYMISNRPERRDQDGCNSYYWYYATLALFQEEGVAWETWNSRLKEVLLGLQVGEEHGTAAGSWDPLDRRAQLGGRVYSTAISILCLEVYYRYAPQEKK